MKETGNKERHKTIKHKAKIYVDGDTHTNTVESAFSLLQRGLIGTWHKLSAKHLHAYLTEMEFRFNRRNHEAIFIWNTFSDPILQTSLPKSIRKSLCRPRPGVAWAHPAAGPKRRG